MTTRNISLYFAIILVRARIENPCHGNGTVENHVGHCCDRHMLDRRTLSSWLFALIAGACTVTAAVSHAQPAAVAARSGGIWKAAVPTEPMRGEFDNFDPLGVAVGARIRADCSLNWIDPDDGKRYCFSSGTSLEFFLDKPRANLLRARAGWRKLTAHRK